MVNLLLDFGNEDGLSGYAGGGIGIADVKMNPFVDGPPDGAPNGPLGFSDSKSGIAWMERVSLLFFFGLLFIGWAAIYGLYVAGA